MPKVKSVHVNEFKRFTDLKIGGLSQSAHLIQVAEKVSAESSQKTFLIVFVLCEDKTSSRDGCSAT
jgi:hypothetical protein